jgi:PAS domain S-box-containing protein
VATHLTLLGNLVIACAYTAICTAILIPVARAGHPRANRLAVATALIFFTGAVGHALHAAAALRPGPHHTTGWIPWPTAAWDILTAAAGIYYWTLRRTYGALLGTGDQHRHHDIELRERVAEGRAQAEGERDAHAAMLRAVIANSQSAIYVKNLDGRYLLTNKTFQDTFGVTEDEILGQTDHYLDPELAPTWRANDRRAHHGPVNIEETDGTGRHYDSRKFPLYDANGTLYAICGVSLDVTDLHEATRTAEHARDEALAQSQIKSDFLATMSHEIRTPMNGVLGLATLLLGTDLDTTQRRYATGIHSAGNALLGVINDILDFSKIEAGKVILDNHDFDLGAVLADTAALVTPAADDKGLTVVTRRGPHLPATVRGDGGRLRQILINLAGNAVKFTGKGSITVRADLVPTRPGSDAHVIRFEVTDTGIGITPTDAEHLFQPFTQADASTTRTYGGTGLGLAISRRLTEAMGGTIGVDSEPGQGSTFWCEIPFEPATGPTTTPAHTTGLRILVTGTGPDRTDLEADLRRWHMTVTTADTATEAVQTLRDAARSGRPYDLLLLDADPGDVDTGGLARLVAADPAIPAVHTVVLNDRPPTGPTGPGAPTYLPKPVHRSALYDLLAQSLTATPAPVTSIPAPAPATRGTVLLVEDNDINQMVAVGVLTSLGYHADIAGDGRQACDMAAAGHYDAILMDCRMPTMDGFAATAEIRRHEQDTGRHTPIIAMTASALVADRDRCLAAGMDDYLAKPVNPGQLDAALHRWITDTPAADTVTVAHDTTDPIGRRLDELAGDHTPPETALVQRLVSSFRTRAPAHLAALTDAYAAGDHARVEDQAHSLKGAAGNIGATAVMEVCQRLEDDARAGHLPERMADDLRTLRLELDQVDLRLQEILSPV